MIRFAQRVCQGMSVLAGMLTLSACAPLGPDYESPEVAWLADWQPDLYGQLAGVAGPRQPDDLRFWWRLFDDPVLDALMDAARRENPTLRIAGLRIMESRAALGIAQGTLYPQFQQAGGAVTYVNAQKHGGQAADRSQSLTSYQADLSVGWELDFWGRFRRGIESADAAFFSALANHQDVQVLLAAQVADLYFAYRTTSIRMHIARENAAIQKRSLEITRLIYERGQGSELDLQQAKSQYLSTLATIPGLEALLIRVRNSLCALLGRAPGDLAELEDSGAQLPVVEPVAIRDIPARLLLRRPDVRVSAWQVAAQSAQIGIAQADLYPAITLVGSVGWTGDTLNASSDVSTLAVGPGFAWNLFNYGRIRNSVRLQDARLQQAIEGFQNTVLLAAREIDDAAINVVKTREEQMILAQALDAAERSLALAQTRYQEGYADFQRVLDAQRVLFNQAEREIVNRGNHISAIIDLYKAIGGGWLDTPVEQLIPDETRETMELRSNWGDLLTAPLPPGAGAPSSASEASP